MLEIEQILSKVENENLQKSLLSFHSGIKTYLNTYPAKAGGAYAEPGDLGIFTRQVMNYALSIFLNDASDGEITFSMDDVILVSFASALDAIWSLSRVKVDKASKDKKDEEFVFIEVRDWMVDYYAVTAAFFAQGGIMLSGDQIHALTFRLGGWSEYRTPNPDISQLAAVIHAAYLLALKFRPSEVVKEHPAVKPEVKAQPNPSELL